MPVPLVPLRLRTKGRTQVEIIHRVETLEHFIRRVKAGDTPKRMTWVVLVVDETGRVIRKPEREAILRSLGIETATPNEVDVYDWL